MGRSNKLAGAEFLARRVVLPRRGAPHSGHVEEARCPHRPPDADTFWTRMLRNISAHTRAVPV